MLNATVEMAEPGTEAPDQRHYMPGGTSGKGWVKGQSGNPWGKPRHRLPNGKSVPEVARDMTPKALRLLVQVIDDEAQPMPLRVQASQALLRTGHADIVRDANPLGPAITLVVQSLAVPALPTAGVLASPVREHIALPSIPLEDTIDIDAKEASA